MATVYALTKDYRDDGESGYDGDEWVRRISRPAAI
jgi:hypothetical protein